MALIFSPEYPSILNTIHSSSLATYPSAYPKQEADRLEKKPAAISEINEFDLIKQQGFATPEEVKTAIANAGISKVDDTYNNNATTLKALTAYAATQNQPLQSQMTASLSLVDYYA